MENSVIKETEVKRTSHFNKAKYMPQNCRNQNKDGHKRPRRNNHWNMQRRERKKNHTLNLHTKQNSNLHLIRISRVSENENITEKLKKIENFTIIKSMNIDQRKYFLQATNKHVREIIVKFVAAPPRNSFH